MKKLIGKLFKTREEPVERAFKDRSPRVRVPLAEKACFFSADGKSFPLCNLSESGMALLSPESSFPDESWGEIRVGGERVTVKFSTVRRSGTEAGVTFTDGHAGIRALLRRVFNDEFKALEMAEVDSSRQKQVEVGNPKWFYAPGNFELFYVENENKLLRFEIEWNGNVLAMGEDGMLRFGTVDPEERSAASHAKSALVKWASTVLPEHKIKALRLIENVSGLDGDIRRRMQELLSG